MKKIRAEAPEMFEQIKAGDKTITQAKRELKEGDRRSLARYLGAYREAGYAEGLGLRHVAHPHVTNKITAGLSRYNQ